MPGINDFAIKLANVNGTGSASANGLLMQTMFRMGIPVAGKNLFPSNIQGLPTWYEIRVSGKGYGARALDYDLMVAMNAQTYAKDVQEVRSGGYLLYDSTWPLADDLYREDVTSGHGATLTRSKTRARRSRTRLGVCSAAAPRASRRAASAPPTTIAPQRQWRA